MSKEKQQIAPEELIIKNKEDLAKKLQKGIESTDKGELYTLDEVYEELKRILYGGTNWKN